MNCPVPAPPGWRYFQFLPHRTQFVAPIPLLERPGIVQAPGFAFQQFQIVQRLQHELTLAVTARVNRNRLVIHLNLDPVHEPAHHARLMRLLRRHE